MDSSQLAMLAAGIPAFAAAATFIAGQVIRAASMASERRSPAVTRLMGSLDRIMSDELKPHIGRVRGQTQLDVATQANRLILVCRARDRVIWDRVRSTVNEIAETRDLEKVQLVSGLQGLLSVWLVSRRKARRFSQQGSLRGFLQSGEQAENARFYSVPKSDRPL